MDRARIVPKANTVNRGLAAGRSSYQRRRLTPLPFVNYIPGPVCVAVRAFGALGFALGIVALIALSLDLDLEGAVGDKIGVDWHSKHADDAHPVFGARNRGPLTVVTIATRGYDARDWVTSLRTVGQWFGDVVVLSDGCAPDPEDCRVVRINTKEHGPSSALAAKHFKTRLFELAAPTSSTALLFMDVDIQINAPLEDYLSRVRHLQHKHAHEIHDSPDQLACQAWFNRERFWQRWKQGHEWQGGFFFLPSAAVSTAFLDAWSDQIDLLPPKALDQTALVNALALHSDELRVCALPSGAMSYVPDLWSRFWGVSKTTFTHWTKSSEVRSWRQIPSSTTGAFSLTHFLRGISIPAEASERRPRRIEKGASEC